VTLFLFLLTADPPCIASHPKGLKDAVPGQSVTFTVSATGTEPISYQWRWTLVGSGNESEKEEWQRCDVKRSDSHTLTISSVQKPNEGSYHCVVSNCAGSQISEPAVLSVGKNLFTITLCMHKNVCILTCSTLPGTGLETRFLNQKSLAPVRIQTS